MKRHKGRIVGGLLAGLLVIFAGALAFIACIDPEADDCRNTGTCPIPDYCLEAGDAREEIDGCF